MKKNVSILGAGLVGTLLAIMLRKRGYNVTIYEGRPDVRVIPLSAGRSINLTISARGWKALEMAGLKQEVEAIAIPMYGRCLHQANGDSTFQPYSTEHDGIFSVNRSELNKRLMTLAEECGVTILFEHRCTHVDVVSNIIHFELPDKTEKVVHAGLLFGADGAFSALRESYSRLNGVSSDRSNLEYGYKELGILPGAGNEWLLEKNALHIWPRGKYMLLAMPNTDGAFTCTLFLPFEGDISFEQLKTGDAVASLFEEQFADAKPLMPGLLQDFFTNPTSSLLTTHISKWHYKGQSALIGDAAHAILPFYGQGMNAGFEDCTILIGLIDKYGDKWEDIFAEYEQLRKPNGDAIAQLAVLNFTEIRDKVADPEFLQRKKIEQELGKRYPKQFVSVYQMVSFTHAPYQAAIRSVAAQDTLLCKIMKEGDFFKNIRNGKFAGKITEWVAEYYKLLQQPCNIQVAAHQGIKKVHSFYPINYRPVITLSA